MKFYKAIACVAFTILTVTAQSQQPVADTVIIPLAKSSQIIFTIEDKNDLEILKHYNFQNLFDDLIKKLEANDTTRADTAEDNEIAQAEEEDWDTPSDERAGNDDDDDNDDDDNWDKSRRGRIGRTWQSTNVDFGTNNFMSDGKFPDADNELYSVRPWGSWYIGLNSVQRTRLGKNIFLEWGLGASWYNFKFEKDNIAVTKDETGVHFTEDTRDVDFIKSKLAATYLNASLVPMLDFGDHSRKPRMWDGHGSEFRIGVGPYIGYRIASKSKLVYKDESDRETDRNRSNFYLNNVRYGARLQVGFRSTDFFLNYDMNELFAADKGPKLNAISFGFIF